MAIAVQIKLLLFSFVSNLTSLGCRHVGSHFPLKSRNGLVWIVFDALAPHASLVFFVFFTSLLQTTGHKMAALIVMFSQLLNIIFWQAGWEVEWKTAVCVLYSIPIDKACGASLVWSPLTNDFKEVVWPNVQDVGPFICSLWVWIWVLAVTFFSLSLSLVDSCYL